MMMGYQFGCIQIGDGIETDTDFDQLVSDGASGAITLMGAMKDGLTSSS